MQLVKKYRYNVPFIHRRTGDVVWVEIVAMTDRYVDFARAVAQARADQGLKKTVWEVEGDAVEALCEAVPRIEHPALF